ILEAVAEGRAIPRDKLPKLEKPERKTPPPPDVVELLKVLLKRQSELSDVAARLIATTQDIESIALGEKTSAALHGWRREIFGELAEKMLRGEIALRLNRGAIDLIETKV
ncbi:MAG TPA: ribonuclease D, partial [Parvularculaceae bacterium]|nr:ribonuclease D [Parvularculaceae bacterium]